MSYQPATEAAFLRRVLDAIPSLVFVVDDDVCIVDYNAAAGVLLRRERADILRHRGGEALHCIHSAESADGCGRAELCRDCIVRNSVNAAVRGQATVRRRARLQIVFGGQTSDLYALISATPLVHDGTPLVLLVIEDISQLAELHRIVPICLKCGQVRDDDDYWSRVETYFRRHWDLEFTHGYCPKCFQEEMDRLDKTDNHPDGGSSHASRS
jgi:hypothetical protein